MKNKLYILCLLLPLLYACNKNKNKIVEKELEIYVDRFFEEAALRAIEVSDDDLEVVFKDLSDEGVCGFGYFMFEGTDLRKVEINPDFFCWLSKNEFGRESLVFHELGHALLRRTHVNTDLPIGVPAQLMCDGNFCDIFSLYDQYTLGKRAYYIDKLFRTTTEIPAWGKLKSKATLLFEEKVETDTPIGALEFSDQAIADNFSQTIAINPTSDAKSIQLIAREKIANNASGSWVIRLDDPVIEEGLGLRLQAKITTENLEGQGFAMLLRTLSGNQAALDISAATSSRNSTNITGTQTETLYEIDLGYYPSDVRQIALIFQLLPNTTGTVYIDDIQLDIMEVE